MLELSEKYINLTVEHCNDLKADLVALNPDGKVIFISALGYDSHIKQTQRTLNDRKETPHIYLKSRYFRANKNYKIITKKSKTSDYTHMIAYSEDIYSIRGNNESFTTYIFTNHESKIESEVFNRLKKYSSIPILEEWMPYIVTELKSKEVLRELTIHRYIPQDIATDFVGYELIATKDTILEVVQQGLRTGYISIDGTSNPSESLSSCTGIDSYLNIYGEGLAKKIQQSFRPKFIPGEDEYSIYVKNIDDYIHYKTGKELYEAQRSTIQAITKNMSVNNTTILCGEMGAGFIQ